MNLHQEKGCFVLIDFFVTSIVIGVSVYLMFSMRF